MAAGHRFNPPPGWLVPPGFTPTTGWQPDPSWPPAPAGWQYWIADASSDQAMTAAARPAPGLGTPPPLQPTVSIPAPTPAAWGKLGGAPGAATPPGPFHGAQPTSPASGMGVGIGALVLGILGLFAVVIMHAVVYALVHNDLTYSARFQTEENALAWMTAACLLVGAILGGVGVRRPKGGAALAALIICAVSGALCSVPIY